MHANISTFLIFEIRFIYLTQILNEVLAEKCVVNLCFYWVKLWYAYDQIL